MEEMVESKISLPDSSFWKNKNVLLTGHSGFKGTWMSIILNSFEANVCGISLRPNTEPNLFNLCKIESEGVMGTILGRSIYEGKIDFETAQKYVEDTAS